MANKVRKATSARRANRANRKARFRTKLLAHGNERPRLVVFRSNKFLYAQVVDDAKGVTLVQANTKEKDFASLGSKKSVDAAKQLGKVVGERAVKEKIEKVVFDRNGYDFHGRVKAVAEAAREAGLKF